MKAIIIDDEKHVREGLILLGEWERHGIDTILEAEDGEEAMKMISLHCPEIIFTDMRMPKKDGISLLKWLHSSSIQSKTIVISGYDDFDYMRNAIYYKSFDYILKPIDPEILNQSLDRAVKEWHDQEEKRKASLDKSRVINEVKPIYWDSLLSNLLTKTKITTSTLQKIHDEFNIDLTDKAFRVAIFPIKTFMTAMFQEDVDSTYFSIINVCNEVLRKHNNCGVCFRNTLKDRELVILFWNDSHVENVTEQLSLTIYQVLQLNITLFLGEKANHLAGAYESSSHVYLKHNLLERFGKSKVVTEKKINGHHITYLFDYSKEIKWTAKSGSIEQIDTLLDTIYRLLESRHYLSLEQLEIWENEFEHLSNNLHKEFGLPEHVSFYRNKEYWGEDGSFIFQKFKDEKRKEFHVLIKTLSDGKYQKEKNSMQPIEEYLRYNYQQDISLQEIADQFFLSREYISRKFKQEFNETITDYLTKIRLEKAREMLGNPYFKIYEVAYQVGYHNEKYFSKVFKKAVGMSPNEYRSSLSTKSQ